MSSTVRIPFRTFLEVGSNKFKVRVPRRFLRDENVERTFAFSFLSLIPEYYSQQALYNKLDAPGQDDWETEYDIQAEFEFGSTYMGRPKVFAPATDGIETFRLIKLINTHFDNTKPDGCTYPPLVIDWFIDGWDTSGSSFRDYHIGAAPIMYGAKFDPSMHDNYLPQAFRSLKSLNNLAFPITKDEEVLKTVRVRITLSNNTEIGFSNEKLLAHLGFAPEQIPSKSARGQVIVRNIYSQSLIARKAMNSPAYKLEDARTSKITPYPTEKKIVTEVRRIKSTRQKDQIPGELVSILNPVLVDLGIDYNQNMGIKFDNTTKSFVLKAPAADGIKTTVRMPSKLSKLLGFGIGGAAVSGVVPEPVQESVSIEVSERLSRTAVYDVGMVVVNLEQQCSLQTWQFSDTLMATLEPNYAGTMSTRKGAEMPGVRVTYFSPELEFKVYRFSEQSVPIPLGLQIGAYIQGVLLGKSINTDPRA